MRTLGRSGAAAALSVLGELMEEMEMEEPTENWLGEVATMRPRRGFPEGESGTSFMRGLQLMNTGRQEKGKATGNM